MNKVRIGLLGQAKKFFQELLKTDEISISQLLPEAADRLRRNQMRGAMDQMRVFLAGTTLFAPIISMQAWDKGVNTLAILYTLTMWFFSWWLFYRWHQTYKTDGCKKDMDRFVLETRFNAGLYCLGMVLFYPVVAGTEKTVICALMVGSLALGTVGFSHAPRAAFWYLGIHTVTMVLVPLICGLYWQSTGDLIISGLSVIGGFGIGNATLERARAQMKSFVNYEALSQKNEVIDLLLKDYEEQGSELMWRTDKDGRIVAIPTLVKNLITSEEDHQNAPQLLNLLEQSIDPQGRAELEKVSHAFAHHAEFHDVVLPFPSAESGSVKWFMMRGRPQFERGKFVGFRGIFADATMGVEAKKQVEFLAQNDPLTVTCNRNFMQTKLDALDALEDKATAYLIDLDGFKQVNDSYGHAIGDQLLQQVAQRIKACLPASAYLARLGGDEFMVLVDDTNRYAPEENATLSQAILNALSQPFLIGQYDILISASIGSAHFPYDAEIGTNLMNIADLALYEAKRRGRNRHVHFVQSMQSGLQKRKIITDRLRHALEENTIAPHYQAQHCAHTNKLVGFEALARWSDPEFGIVGPDIFIPIAEETGLIQQLGEHILLRACRDALTWKATQDGELPTVSVNVSAVQVMRGNIVRSVKSALSKTGLPPDRLEIEVTESVLIDDITRTSKILSDLAAIGVRIALDDFGTGYSSLSYLRALPLHRVKIDRSFIADIDDFEAHAIVQTIIELSNRLGLEVIAEGVETDEQRQKLSAMGCKVLQGYHFSPPVPAHQVPALIENNLVDVA